ncbi:hypothetical protein ONZ45_g625 [Pleurotus djamor]|nr:hypothetical protein ONZ45_g625 [Pleurotus djamor]
MARGRPRLYHTPEERAMANRAKSKRSYDKHKALINIRKTIRYRGKSERKGLINGATKAGIPTKSGWLALAKDTNESFKQHKNGRIRDYVDSLCKRYLNADNQRNTDIFEEELLEIGSFASIISRCVNAVLKMDGVGTPLRTIQNIQRSVRDAESALEDAFAHVLGGYAEFTETYQLGKFVYQSYMN